MHSIVLFFMMPAWPLSRSLDQATYIWLPSSDVNRNRAFDSVPPTISPIQAASTTMDMDMQGEVPVDSSVSYNSQQNYVVMPGISIVACPDMLPSLAKRFPHLAMVDRLEIADKYIVYVGHARRLAQEIEVWNKQRTTAEIEKYSAADLAELDKAAYKATMLKDMRTVCMQTIQILEVGDLDELQDLVRGEEVNDAFIQTVVLADPSVEEVMERVWPHLHYVERVLRLKLL